MEENILENQNGDCSVFLIHLSVETILSKLKHFHSYLISRLGMYYGKGFRRTRINSIPLLSFFIGYQL